MVVQNAEIADAWLPGKLERVSGHRKWEQRTGIALSSAVVLACVIVPLVSHADPVALVAAPLQAPSLEHPFGTDTLGRDVFIRVFSAGRVDIALGALGVMVPLVFGTVVGTLVGASRRRAVDDIVMRLTDAVMAFPFMILVLVIVMVVGSARLPLLPVGSLSILAAVWLVDWTFYARLARTQTLALRNDDFVSAAHLLGYSQARIVVRHLLPSVWPTTATYAVAKTLFVIAVVAGLPFLGAGIQPPAAEWGSIMYEGRGYLAHGWWISLTTAGVMLTLGVGVMMVVDARVGGSRRFVLR